jgi:hypothetical protein
MLLRNIRLGAVRRDTHDARPGAIPGTQIVDSADARQQQRATCARCNVAATASIHSRSVCAPKP